MHPPRQQLQVTVVGHEITALLEPTLDSSRPLSVSAVRAETLSPTQVEADCLVVDQATVESWTAILERFAERRPQLPIVVVLEDAFASTVGTAIEAGATDYLPRSLCENQPSLVVPRLASAVESGFEDSSHELFESVSNGGVIHEPKSSTADAVGSQPCGEPLEQLDLLADGYAREILMVLSRGPRGGRELAGACDCSRPTVYRRLNRLEDAGLVTSELRIDPNGNHCKEFRLLRDSLQVTIADGTLAVDAATISVDD